MTAPGTGHRPLVEPQINISLGLITAQAAPTVGSGYAARLRTNRDSLFVSNKGRLANTYNPRPKYHEFRCFSCGMEGLGRYLRTQAGQDVRRRSNGVFVLARSKEPTTVLGYYTLCATVLAPGDIPEAARKFVPRYPMVSATLIGRLAVATHCQGQRLGALLLADASRRAYVSAGTIGSSMLIVDALDERAAAFYAAHGFVRLPDSLRLLLSIRQLASVQTAEAGAHPRGDRHG